MTVPRWLIPVLAIVAALAVAVAATLIGTQLAAKPQPQTLTVPVLQPVETGDDGLPVEDRDGDPETLDISASSGDVEIIAPGTGVPGRYSAQVDARIDALVAAGGLDEASTSEAIASADDGAGPAAGDPCSPADGTIPEGCPMGMRGAIFGLVSPPALQVFARVAPPSATAEGRAGTVFCETVADEPGSVVFGVATTTPSSVSIRYWPTDDPGAEETVTIAGLADEEAAWNDHFERNGTYSRSSAFQHCTTLTGLRPNTPYESSTTAVDSFLRISSPLAYSFDSRGEPTRPPLMLRAIDNNVLMVSLPTRVPTDNFRLPEMRLWIAEEGGSGGCSDWSGARDVARSVPPAVSSAQQVTEVSPDYLRERNYDPTYSLTVTQFYVVPEGSDLVFCARWFNIASPSWSRTVPIEEVQATVTSPDAILPVITVTGVDLYRDVPAGSIRLSAFSTLGVECGSRLTFPATDYTAGQPSIVANDLLCRPGRVDAGPTEPARLEGTDIAIQSIVGSGSSTIESTALLPLSDYACLGTCVLPPTSVYRVLLPTIEYFDRCPDYFTYDCNAPTRADALGTVSLTVSWEQGNRNGSSTWRLGGSYFTRPGAPVTDYPQLDISQGFPGGLTPDGFEAFTTVPIRSDRHVSYRTTVSGDCFLEGFSQPAEGESSQFGELHVADVRIEHLCPGATYTVSVELTDDAGRRAIYDINQPWGPFRWQSSITMPQNSSEYDASIEITATRDDLRPWGIAGAEFIVGGPGAPVDYARFPEDLCFYGLEPPVHGEVEYSVTQERMIHLSVSSRIEVVGSIGREANCRGGTPTDRVLNLEADISWEDFLRGVSFTQYFDRPSWVPASGAWDPEFQATVTIRGTAP